MQGKKSDINSEEYNNELRERIKSKTRMDEIGCWIWIGLKDKKNYGIIRAKRKNYAAHRLSYELFVGDLKKGHYICHHCDNPPCVNPKHLFQGTQSDNIHDALRKKRIPSGEKRSDHKLDWDKIKKIRELASQNVSQRKIANIFGVSHSCIGKVLLNKSWKENEHSCS